MLYLTHCFACEDGVMHRFILDGDVKWFCNSCSAEKHINGSLRTKEQFRNGAWVTKYLYPDGTVKVS
jgi:hypothetical protein